MKPDLSKPDLSKPDLSKPGLPQHPALWRGRQRLRGAAVLPSGHAALDRCLPDGGWPRGGLIELLTERPGLGELSLLLPALARHTGTGGWLVMVGPPWLPCPAALHGHGLDLRRLLVVHAAGLRESLWACEQVLREARGGILLSWLEDERQAGFPQLRRLQLAAGTGTQAAFVFRPARVAAAASPAVLRAHLRADTRNLHLTLLKGRGLTPGTAVRIRRAHQEAYRENLPPTTATNCPGTREPWPDPVLSSAGTRPATWI